MSKFILPERQKSMPFLSQLKRELTEKEKKLEHLKVKADELATLRDEFLDLEKRIVTAKSSMYTLLSDRFKRSEILSIEAYSKLLEAEIEAASESKKGGGP